MKQLSGQDAMYLHSESSGFPNHIGFVAVYDQSTCPSGPVRFKDILSLYEQRLDRSSIFRRRLAQVPLNLDQPYWVDDEDFNLEFHIRHIALPKPGDWRQLCIQISRLHAQAIDKSRPLWESYVIEGLDNVEGVAKGSFCLYTKIHHSAVDGASTMQFIGALTDSSPASLPAEESKPWIPKSAPSNMQLLRSAAFNTLRKPVQLAKFVGEIVPSRLRINRGIKEGLLLPPLKPPSTRFNQAISPHRVIDAISFDFAAIKQIKNAVPNATINDAVLAIVSGGLRRYLSSKKELPEESLVAGCPIDIRNEEQQDVEGNFVGLMTVALCTDDDDPLQRLRNIQQATLSGKAYAEAMGAKVALEFTDSIPAVFQSLLLQLSASAGVLEKNPMQNTTISNVAGPPVQMYLCGAKMVKSFGTGLLSPGLGLFHAVSSGMLANQYLLTVSYLACREMIPDPAFYTSCLNQSFDELLESSRSIKPKKAKRRTNKKRASKKVSARKAKITKNKVTKKKVGKKKKKT